MPNVVPNNIGIEPLFTTGNPTYTNPKYVTKKKLMLHSTATPGAPAKNFHPNWNKSSAGASVEFVLDPDHIYQFMPIGEPGGKNCLKTWHGGGSSNNTHISTEVCEPIQTQMIPINFQTQSATAKYKRPYSIRRIQMELKYLGFYQGEIDGQFGPKTTEAVKAYQRSKGMTADGAVGKATLYKLQARTGSYCLYDVEAAEEFFNNVYNKSVMLFAFLCQYIGGNPAEIICHSEGYKKGIASNHADVTHWFPLHGKSMDDFRSDVAKYIAGSYIPLGMDKPAGSVSGGVVFDTPGDVAKLVRAGIINTPDYWSNLNETSGINNNFVMALLRQAGIYYCRKSYIYAIDALTECCNFNSAAMWKQSETYSLAAVRCLYIAIAQAIKGMSRDDPMGYLEAVEICYQEHIINSPDYWINLRDGDQPDPQFVRALMRQAGAYFCTKGYKNAVDAIKNAINMNSVDYWKGGKYNVTNVRYLLKAMAASC